MKLEIDREKCINCAGCASVCPVFALRMTSNGPEWDPKLCTGCGLCEKVCPVKAITLEK